MRLCIPALIFLFALTGCSAVQTPALLGDTAASRQQTAQAAEELLARDPGGPIAEPVLPPELIQAAAAHAVPADADAGATPIRYRVDSSSPDDPVLAEEFMRISQIARMQDTPIYTVTALEQRLRSSLSTGHDILHSFGYYAGEVEGWLETESGQADLHTLETENENGIEQAIIVKVRFRPGERYTIGKTQVLRTDQPDLSALPPELAEQIHFYNSDVRIESDKKLPRTLTDVGLNSGMPALATDVLDAVSLVQDAFRNNGYPDAAIAATRYVLDNSNQELEAVVVIAPHRFALMGPIELQDEDHKVSARFIRYLKTWEIGEPWNQAKVEQFRNSLRASGLFSSIDLNPAAENTADGLLPVETTLTAAAKRTVGASVRYDTSFGLGLQAFWQHRNFTGNGDSLRAELSAWPDLQELVARYRMPFAFGRDYDFIAQGGLIYQDTDAYRLQAARTAAGVEWRASRNWRLAAQGSVEGGWIKDPEKPKKDYLMFGLPLSASFSSANSLLDATDGGRAIFFVAPYSGFYDGNFDVVRSRIDLHRFIPLTGDDTLVLALRAAVGGLLGDSAREVPPSVRFYSGGGGSVRGYTFQSLGPRNDGNDPLGGSSLLEISIEPRYRINDTFGVVAFIDGGMVYEEFDDPRFGRDLQWGAGVGARLYTAIGPIRFDVATPLNPRTDDSSLHFYISIGQSF